MMMDLENLCNVVHVISKHYICIRKCLCYMTYQGWFNILSLDDLRL